MHTCNASLSRRPWLVYSARMQVHPLISDSTALENFCSRLASAEFIAVDTEFMRENSYWPDLCLIQLATPDEAAAIDPKAPGLARRRPLDLRIGRASGREGRRQSVWLAVCALSFKKKAPTSTK